jgi:hypothetical protein
VKGRSGKWWREGWAKQAALTEGSSDRRGNSHEKGPSASTGPDIKAIRCVA